MLKLENIKKRFSKFEKPVLQDISMILETGEFCVILGSNGSGKSTLLKCISGEYKIDEGQIFIDDINITNSTIHKRAKDLSLVNQDINSGTVSDLTVLENIILSSGRCSLGSLSKYANEKDKISQKISELGLGLEKFINKKMSELSGGQRQSIATLMAINPAPKLLLLDEHTSALDPRARNNLLEFTDMQIRSNNITSLMITHNIDDALKYGSRLIIMQHGQIITDLSKKEKSKISSKEILDILHKNDDFTDNVHYEAL